MLSYGNRPIWDYTNHSTIAQQTLPVERQRREDVACYSHCKALGYKFVFWGCIRMKPSWPQKCYHSALQYRYSISLWLSSTLQINVFWDAIEMRLGSTSRQVYRDVLPNHISIGRLGLWGGEVLSNRLKGRINCQNTQPSQQRNPEHTTTKPYQILYIHSLVIFKSH